MRKIVAICGRPGSGKTSLMRKFMEAYVWERVEPAKLVVAEYCKELDLYVVGKYDDGVLFAGTDTLSMAAAPAVTDWLKSIKSNVIWEGDRLTGTKMFDSIMEMDDAEPTILVIQADAELKKRYKDRGSDQPEQFLKAKETKINNITSNFDYRTVTEVYDNNNYDQQKIIVDRIKNILC